MVLDGGPSVFVVGTKPGGVSGGVARNVRDVRVGFGGVGLGWTDGGCDLRLLV